MAEDKLWEFDVGTTTTDPRGEAILDRFGQLSVAA